MSDEELDREWTPKGRPQSTIARSFSTALNDIFKIDNSLADLDAAVDQKKKAVSTHQSELEALEARLKATEERLKQRQSMIGMPTLGGSPSPRHRKPLSSDTFSASAPEKDSASEPRSPVSPSPLRTENPLENPNATRTPARPATAKRPSEASFRSGGALPPTPSGSEGDSSSEGAPAVRVPLGRGISADYIFVHKESSEDDDTPPPVPSKTNA